MLVLTMVFITVPCPKLVVKSQGQKYYFSFVTQTVKTYNGDRLTKDNELLTEHQESQRQLLQTRAKQLTEVLQRSGWKPIMPQGGLFLVAKPDAFLGKTVSYEQDGLKQETVIDGDSILT